MDIQRRAFLGGGIALAAGSATASPSSPLSSSPDATFFPPKEHYPLWPGPPPGAPAQAIVPDWVMEGTAPNRELHIRGIASPEIHIFRPARSDGSALLALPGGGYGYLSVQNEGMDVAERFNAERTTVFVLTYRLPGEGWHDRSLVALQDAQRAMRLIRSRAAEFRINPERLGVIGFSAGGHLAADLAVSHALPTYSAIDSADQLSARPAFFGLVYAVVSLDPNISQGESAPNLLGPNPTPDQIAKRTPVLHVTGDTPPSFIVAAFDDGLIHIDNSLSWIAACRRARSSIEAHLIAQGGHGFGFHLPSDNPGSHWPDLFASWMRRHGG